MAMTLFLVYRDKVQFASEVALHNLLQLEFKRATESNQNGFYQLVHKALAKQQDGWNMDELWHTIEKDSVKSVISYRAKFRIERRKQRQRYNQPVY
jgi:hypothetical protein